RRDHEKGRFTLVVLGQPGGASDTPQIELTHNSDQTDADSGGSNYGHGAYSRGRNRGAVAYEVDNAAAPCERLIDKGYTISRPPRDGRMAFVRSPDLISVELLTKGAAVAAAAPRTSLPH